MRLKSIKLAGFKSFVDATTAYFPTNMTAVVGPNGCGKSNIIDAVRWVMGEGSAKNLRGESMIDVIFNGSNTRKPVTQASIELIFDNSDGTLLGEYASYAEISIRRRVTRDGQNQYFLNGTKCRRRDITDIFLGTGLGPRSYSIIEQGMISRLIEARPEDLRNYIEEAAGISKYKERRRETENRIHRTQENLARLSDLREELGRQLERLHSQAKSAEKYQQYKIEERQLKAELTAIRWQTLHSQTENHQRIIREQELALEALITEQQNADTHIEQHRDKHHDLSEHFNQVQGRFYAIGGEIARFEQSIQHSQQRLKQLQEDSIEAEHSYQEALTTITADEEQLAIIAEEVLLLEPEKELLAAKTEEAAIQLHEVETAMATWQEQWHEFTQKSNDTKRQAEVQQSRTQHFEQSLERIAERMQRFVSESEQLNADPQAAEILLLNEQLSESELVIEQVEEEKGQFQQAIQNLRGQRTELDQRYQKQQNDSQRLAGRIASLEALQQAALNPDSKTAQWLTEQGLANNQHLADRLKVVEGWELAVETILGADLQAIICDSLDNANLHSFTQGELRLIQPIAMNTTITNSASLLDKVISKDIAPSWLAMVIPVETLDEALAQRAGLTLGQSLITKDGYWVGSDFIRIKRGEQTTTGVLARAQELDKLVEQQAQLEEIIEQTQQEIEQLNEQLQNKEQSLADQHKKLQQLTQQMGELKAKLVARRAQVEQVTQRRQYLDKEISELTIQQQAQHEELKQARALLQEALDQMAEYAQQDITLQSERGKLQTQLEHWRREERVQKDQLHQLSIKLNGLVTQQQAIEQSLQRLKQQIGRLQERKELLQSQLAEGSAPIEELRFSLEEQLEKRLQVEEELKQARLALEDADSSLRETEQRRIRAEQQSQALRSQLEQQRLDWQGLNVRKKSFQEQLQEDSYDLHTLLQNLSEEANEADWVKRLEQVTERINRLGAINLAAIEEYQQQSERKNYLDAQNNDLVEALATLENVIQKIDKETRQRFKETFDKINDGLQKLFPKVFGGGMASLELTGEDLLSTGVAIMARPPGKKNSTIHLLSGGEKALTALALVFAIFQLNPAPFCMLDEVDAPLDDTNVGRYANLVKEMSEKVQFIYITHNKIAMEQADQLMGVTMHEPGCSRLVAVNMEEAVALTEV
ncbi:chromosome segregation protein SMC [Entomomonas sp. E2T0]|uniref:chromosome segregation protein SMC n=1 Tax=Entomomonas sp. E2T0 TaxID=2930213 RepID=UPI00222848CB|nr:chromosome segregation protein SMC [Entomomonas sp. E2T0]UYZ83254.1 chromosome segregation protein SMC [Entomomonas sp. E2T0]